MPPLPPPNPLYPVDPPMWVVVILSSMAPICVLGLFVILGIMFNVIGLADVMQYMDFG